MGNQTNVVAPSVETNSDDMYKAEEHTAASAGDPLPQEQQSYVRPDDCEEDASSEVVCKTIEESRRFLDRLIEEETGIDRTYC